ncbi:MAG TPA: hypothetical protein VJ183_12005 [Chloroflexia bacterium]|nr:hypothetical protein [Chloroflexia bacterium]
MTTTQAKMPLPRKLGYIFIGILTFAVLALAIIQPIIFSMVENVPGSASIASDSRGWPTDDKRGAFLMLNEPHGPQYPGNLLALLATTEPGVIDEKAGAHLLPGDIKAILIQSSALNESADYRVYRIGVVEDQKIMHERQPGGKVMLITNSAGKWEPGAYMVDVPSDGMFGGRTYYQFYVDSE